MADWWNYPTNYSNGTVVDGVGKLFIKYPSYIISQFPQGILLLIWVSIFGVLSATGTEKALLASSFITFIFSVYFFMAGVLNPVVPIALIVLTIIGAIGSKERTL